MMKLPSVLLLLLAPMVASCFGRYLPENCMDIHNKDKTLSSGVFTIYPSGSTSAVEVYCDMETDGGGWTVFQRRMDGSVNFYRPWNQYKSGFGNASGEYWLGLENIYELIRQRYHELWVDMEDFDGKKVFARYSFFAIKAESDGYSLHVSGFINGGANDAHVYHSSREFSPFDKDQDNWPDNYDALVTHNGRKFSTFDKDQDASSANCAKYHLGAFWYHACHHANPNGVYRWGADGTIFAIGVEWSPWKGNDYSLKSISFKIRPVT